MQPDFDDALRDGFIEAMRSMASTVSVVTAVAADGAWVGMTATSVTSVSMAPPSLLVCINRNSASHAAVTAAGCFCVNVLTDDQADHCRLFATPGPKTDCFASGDWSLVDGVPCLSGARAVIPCRVAAHLGHGSHGVFVGDVQTVRLGGHGRTPLVYLNQGIVPLGAACV